MKLETHCNFTKLYYIVILLTAILLNYIRISFELWGHLSHECIYQWVFYTVEMSRSVQHTDILCRKTSGMFLLVRIQAKLMNHCSVLPEVG